MSVYQVFEFRQACPGEGFCRIGGRSFRERSCERGATGYESAGSAPVGTPVGPRGFAKRYWTPVGVKDGDRLRCSSDFLTRKIVRSGPDGNVGRE